MLEIKRFLTHNIIYGVHVWNIIASVLILLLSIGMRKIFRNIILKSAFSVARKTKSSIDDEVLVVISKPVEYLIVEFGIYFSLLALGILSPGSELSTHLWHTIIIINLFWALYRAKHIMKRATENYLMRKELEDALAFMPLFNRIIEITIVVFGVVSLLQEWGYNIGTIITGLGIGGLAVAFAARDTLANFFGSVMIMLDKPFRIGDWIKTSDIEGTVEDIGLRSTKIRQFDKAIVAVPNSKLATEPIINFSRRNKRRIKLTIGVTYSTPIEKLREAVSQIKLMLIQHPEIDKETIFTFFTEFGESSLNIFIYCFTTTSAWGEYLRIREDVSLKIMEIFQRLDIEFAFPSMSIYIEKEPEHYTPSE